MVTATTTTALLVITLRLLLRHSAGSPDSRAHASTTIGLASFGGTAEGRQTADVFAYRMPRRRNEANYEQPPSHWQLVRRGGPAAPALPAGWQWQDTDLQQLNAPLRHFLETRIAALPADVKRLEESKFIISVYWQEREDGVGLTKIIDFLKDCAALKVIPDATQQGLR